MAPCNKARKIHCGGKNTAAAMVDQWQKIIAMLKIVVIKNLPFIFLSWQPAKFYTLVFSHGTAPLAIFELKTICNYILHVLFFSVAGRRFQDAINSL